MSILTWLFLHIVGAVAVAGAGSLIFTEIISKLIDLSYRRKKGNAYEISVRDYQQD